MSSKKDNVFQIVRATESPILQAPKTEQVILFPQKSPSKPPKDLLGPPSLPKRPNPRRGSYHESRRGIGSPSHHPPGVMEDLVLALLAEMEHQDKVGISEGRVLH